MQTIYNIYEGIFDKGNRQSVGDDLKAFDELNNFKITAVKKAPYPIDVDGKREFRKERVDFLITIDCPNLLAGCGIKSNKKPTKIEIRSKMEKWNGGYPVQTHYSHQLWVQLLNDKDEVCSARADINMETWTTQKDCKSQLLQLINKIGSSRNKFDEFIDLCWNGNIDKYNYVTGTFKFIYN